MEVAALEREVGASGVMMIPIPRAGILRGVGDIEEARAVPGIEDLRITIPVGQEVVPLPEGSRYLGFIFARAEAAERAESGLREAHRRLRFDIASPPVVRLDLIENVAPVQLAIRLLIPAGSRLLELPEVRALVGPFDEAALCHPWAHPVPGVDALHREIEAMVREATAGGGSRTEIFVRAWEIAKRAAGGSRATDPRTPHVAREPKRPPVPFLTEPWYC